MELTRAVYGLRRAAPSAQNGCYNLHAAGLVAQASPSNKGPKISFGNNLNSTAAELLVGNPDCD